MNLSYSTEKILSKLLKWKEWKDWKDFSSKLESSSFHTPWCKSYVSELRTWIPHKHLGFSDQFLQGHLVILPYKGANYLIFTQTTFSFSHLHLFTHFAKSCYATLICKGLNSQVELKSVRIQMSVHVFPISIQVWS